MNYVLYKDNKIVAWSNVPFDNAIEVNEEIVTIGVDMFLASHTEEIAQAQTELEQKTIEEQKIQAEKPTTEDLVEALDILSSIVLGGAE